MMPFHIKFLMNVGCCYSTWFYVTLSTRLFKHLHRPAQVHQYTQKVTFVHLGYIFYGVWGWLHYLLRNQNHHLCRELLDNLRKTRFLFKTFQQVDLQPSFVMNQRVTLGKDPNTDTKMQRKLFTRVFIWQQRLWDRVEMATGMWRLELSEPLF